MKVVILAGGYGTRLSEESAVRPKPMVEIGDKPIIWHIMKIYSAYGLNDFILCAGYKGYMLKEYFANYFLHLSDVTFDIARNEMTAHASGAEPWKVTIVDTGAGTMTGGRLKRVEEFIGEETFCMTYGDCVGNVNIPELIDAHREYGTVATLTAVQPPGRFGVLSLPERGSKIETFTEKPTGDGGWINGGFFVLEPRIMDYIADESTVFEREPLQKLAREGKLAAYKHEGYWQNMDTLRDKMMLEEQWGKPSPPWKLW